MPSPPHPRPASSAHPLRAAFAAVVALVGVLTMVAVAGAHDFWLVPDAFRIAEGGRLEVRGQTSSRFPTSEAAVALDRVADARLIGSASDTRIADLSHRGTSLLLRARPEAAGQYAVAVALHPRSVRESAAGFRRYLELEGAPEALSRIDREGLLRGRDSITRRYAKYAKTLVQVGSAGPRAFARTAAHPLEFVPERDPATLAAGDTLRVRLLYRGQPLAGVRAHAGAVDPTADRGAPPSRDAGGAAGAAAGSRTGERGAAGPEVHVTTDASGVLALPVTRGGLWNIRTIHVVQAAPNSGADWDTHWATLVFQVGGAERSSREQPDSETGGDSAIPADSVAVARVVERFGRALAEGDSAAALALLAPQALVLEGGGVETREEYRAHHLAGDIRFARAIQSTDELLRVTVQGDAAWTISTSTSQGEYGGRAIDSVGAELMVLVRTPEGWRISAIHWSSRTRRR